MPSAVFFDLDGTLFNYLTSSQISLKEVLTYHKIPPQDFEMLHKKFESINIRLWTLFEQNKASLEFIRLKRFQDLLVDFSLSESTLNSISNEYLSILGRQKHINPNVVEILEYLVDKYPLAVITNGIHEVQLSRLKATGLDKYFRKVITSESVGSSKPDKRIFQSAIDAMGVQIHEAVYIGDSITSDLQGTSKIGMPFIFYNPTKQLLPTSMSVPQWEIQNLIELKMLL